ncbi:hypothetical protein JW905_13655 [bacterium]|nr:hypothetical protein [candidate division CSSED10-310 bacterium]
MGNVPYLNMRVGAQRKWLEQVVFGFAGPGDGVRHARGKVFPVVVRKHINPVVSNSGAKLHFQGQNQGLDQDGAQTLKHLPDNSMHIYVGSRDKIGTFGESFSFVVKNNIQERIVKLRDIDHITEIEAGWLVERVILYRKRIRTRVKNLKRVYGSYGIEGINDITRFNITPFTKKMDDSEKTLYHRGRSLPKTLRGKGVPPAAHH